MEIQTRVPFSTIIAGTMRLGKWGVNFSTNQYREFIEQCMEIGITTFDHADIYGDYTTEGEFGDALAEISGQREKIQIITKCGIRRVCNQRPNHKVKSYDSSKKHIIQSVEQSLRELKTDYIDVLLLHRPDYLMDPDEIGEAVQILNEQDKIIDFGVSNFNTHQFDLLNPKVALCSNQIEISLQNHSALENGQVDQCHTYRLPVMAWSPLGGGRIFGNDKTVQDEGILKVANPLLEKYNCGLDQLLLAWLLRHPTYILPVMGTSKIERLKSAIKASEIKMEAADWYALLQAAKGETIP